MRGHRGQPRPTHIDRHHLVPGVDGNVLHVFAATVGDGGVVDQAIQTPQPFSGLLHTLVHRFGLGHVHRQVMDSGPQLLGQCLTCGVQYVCDDHPCASLHQGTSKSRAQTARTASDQHPAAMHRALQDSCTHVLFLSALGK